MKIGILALQGAVTPHAEKLAELGAEPVEVRTPADLVGLRGIILPGGESSSMIKLLKLNRLWEPLAEFAAHHPTWGVCAGAILLASEVSHPVQESLAKLDIAVSRNAFGRQNESFIDQLEPTNDWLDDESLEGVFIRAPRITKVTGGAKTLLAWRAEPVMVEQGHLMASTFHPELSAGTKIHAYFLKKCAHA